VTTKKYILLAVALAGAMLVFFSLSENLEQKYQNMASEQKVVAVIAPHYKVDIGGAIVGIWGEDVCPKNSFSDIQLDKKGCIVQDGRTEIPVYFNGPDDKEVREIWSVIKQGDQILLRRPNGFIVRGA